MTRVADSKKYVRVNDIVVYSEHSFNYLGNNSSGKTAIKEKKFRCKFCYNTFNNYDNFMKHLKKHEIPIACKLCNFVAYAQTTLTRHLIKHGIGKKSYKCRHCDEVFLYAATRITHENKHIGKMFPCPICNRQFPSISKLNTHEQNHPELNKFFCNLCNKSFPYNYMYKQHFRTKHLKNSVSNSLLPIFSCKFCGKGFRNVEWYKIHEGKHKAESLEENSNMNIFSWDLHFQQDCSLCGAFVENVVKLRAHIFSMHKALLGSQDISNLEICNFCGKDMKRLHFRNEKFLHIIKHLNIIPFKCNICDFRTSWIKSMKRHLGMSHLQKALYSCDECNQTFEKKNPYLQHLKERHQIFALQEFLCDMCGEAVSGKNKIKSHKIKCGKSLKLADELIPCKQCQKKFNNQRQLNIHIDDVHKDLFACEECGVEYANIDIKNQHKVLFSMERVCCLCDFKTEHGTFLSQHIPKIHPEKSFQCDICEMVFASSKCYYKHLKTHEYDDEFLTTHLYKPTYDSEEEELFQLKLDCKNESPNQGLFLFECSVCGLQYSTVNQGLQHELKHMETLNVCDSSLSEIDSLIEIQNENVANRLKIVDISVTQESTLVNKDYECYSVLNQCNQPLLETKYAKFIPVENCLVDTDIEKPLSNDFQTKIMKSLRSTNISSSRISYLKQQKILMKNSKKIKLVKKESKSSTFDKSISVQSISFKNNQHLDSIKSNINDIPSEWNDPLIKNFIKNFDKSSITITNVPEEDSELTVIANNNSNSPKKMHELKELFIVKNNSYGFRRTIQEKFAYVNGKKRLISEDLGDLSQSEL